MWTAETEARIAMLETCCMVEAPDTHEWYRIHWVDGKGTPDGIEVCLVLQDPDGGDDEDAVETVVDYYTISHWNFKAYRDVFIP